MKLTAHGWTLELLPALGGAVGALRYQGNDVLRPAPDGTGDALATGCFPLVPYANRIAQGRFEFGGETHQLPLNFGDHPHSLHGLGWQAEWTVLESGEDHAALAHAHDGGAGWPWAYRAAQHFTLAPGRVTIGLSLTNAAETPMPAGIGLHPYFPLDAQTRLAFAAERVWLADATMLPAEAAEAAHFGDWTEAAPVAGATLIDNAYQGWRGTARIEQGWGNVELGATNAEVLHLYRPPGEGFFCVEPVTHLPDAANRGGMDVFAPGAALRLEMTLSV